MNNSKQIPPEAIEGAAGKYDKFIIESVDTATYFKDPDKEKLPYNVISNKNKREILSTDLDQGITIEAVVTQNRRRAAQEIEKANNKDSEQGK